MDDRKPASADQERRERLNQRLRQAFLEGAEDDSCRRLGRGLTAEELERILWHFPGTCPSAASLTGPADTSRRDGTPNGSGVPGPAVME